MKPKARVSKKKVKEVESLIDLIKGKKTILIASIKNIPASQFQEISKKLRGKAIIKVPKKNLVFRAIDDSEKKELEELKEYFLDNSAILFSDLETYDLATELIKNKIPAKAKPGQEAPQDIEIQEGPTDLVPGPAISELGALGIQIQIEKGKIHIKASKVIAKKGEKISKAAAEFMTKLDIKPFSIGFVPLVSYDTKENKIYLEIKIDPEKVIKEIKEAYSRALAFAVEIAYTSKDTIKFLLMKAARQEKVISSLIKIDDNKGKKDVNMQSFEDINNKGSGVDGGISNQTSELNFREVK